MCEKHFICELLTLVDGKAHKTSEANKIDANLPQVSEHKSTIVLFRSNFATDNTMICLKYTSIKRLFGT